MPVFGFHNNLGVSFSYCDDSLFLRLGQWKSNPEMASCIRRSAEPRALRSPEVPGPLIAGADARIRRECNRHGSLQPSPPLVSTASFRFARATRNWPPSLRRPFQSDPSTSGCVPCSVVAESEQRHPYEKARMADCVQFAPATRLGGNGTGTCASVPPLNFRRLPPGIFA